MRKVIITAMIGVLGLALFYSPAQASKNDPLRPWPRVEHAVTPTEDSDDSGWDDPSQLPPPSPVNHGKTRVLILWKHISNWTLFDFVIGIVLDSGAQKDDTEGFGKTQRGQ